MNEMLYKLWFIDIKIKNMVKIDLLSNGYTPFDFFKLTMKDYINLGLDIIKAQEIEKSKDINKYEKLSKYIIDESISITMYMDEEYPDSLKYIFNPPAAIFLKGNCLELDASIAIVGSRKASEYGKTAAYQIGYELGKRGVTVISGLARGIDSCAHRGCLDAGGYTIGIMGSGFENVYPIENKGLFKEIVSNGCMITEYLPEVRPFPQNFPERNRIISGLSKYVLVIEAGERSGSLITAQLALEQGKDVFAVPGNIYSPNSKGTNKLIKDGAKPILDIDDIIEEFNIIQINKDQMKLDSVEKIIIDTLKKGAMSIDDIFEASGVQVDVLLSTLSRLECYGIIKRAYGNFYMIS